MDCNKLIYDKFCNWFNCTKFLTVPFDLLLGAVKTGHVQMENEDPFIKTISILLGLLEVGRDSSVGIAAR